MGLLDKLSDPYMLMQIMGGVGLLGSKRQSQADKYRDYMTQGLLGYSENQKEKEKKEKLKQALASGNFDPSALADAGYGDAVVGGMVSRHYADPKDRKTAEDSNGVLRYIDDGSPVFPDVVAEPSAEDTEAVIKREDDLSKRFDNLSKDFSAQSQAYGRLMASANENTPAGQMSLIFNFMKVNDPGSTVRESEFSTVEGLGGIKAQLQNMYNKVKNGTMLQPEQIQDIVDSASAMYRNAQDQHGKTYHRFRETAQNRGLNPSNVVSTAFNYPGFVPMTSQGLLGQGKEVTTPDGKKVRIPPPPFRR